MKCLHLLLFLTFAISSFSQVAISDVTPSPQPDSSALFDLQSSQRGILIPRMTQVERDNITNPAHSLMIFNTTTDCFEAYYTGGGWRSVNCNCSSYPSAAFTVNPTKPSQGSPASFTPVYQGTGSYAWTFPNGSPSSSTSQSPSVTWANPDTVSVTLTVTDSNGCSTTGSQTVEIPNCPPIGSNSMTFSNISTGRTGSIQTWTVPAGVCNIQIEAWGAKGGGNLGGNGAYVSGEFQVTPGEVLNILVGQRGGITTQGTGNYCAGGGGGTFVYRNATDPFPLVAAAGGGGQAENGGCNVAGAGGAGSGTATTTNNSTTVGNAPGGTNGNGGSGGLNTGSYSTAGGGGGWLTDGQNGLNLRNPPGLGGLAPRNGATGGLFTHPNYTGADGGFGGGGGGSDNTGAGGGGGGWNGGGGGNNYAGSCLWGAGGGGGSYNGGTNQTNQSGVRTTHGQVIITY